jgi:hypothetical protein
VHASLCFATIPSCFLINFVFYCTCSIFLLFKFLAKKQRWSKKRKYINLTQAAGIAKQCHLILLILKWLKYWKYVPNANSLTLVKKPLRLVTRILRRLHSPLISIRSNPTFFNLIMTWITLVNSTRWYAQLDVSERIFSYVNNVYWVAIKLYEHGFMISWS